MSRYRQILNQYIPEAAIDLILNWLENSNVQLSITRSRNSKLGDYRPPIRNKYHKISVNHDLNKYQFLLTLVHEFAHLQVWEKYKNRVKPHGIEWKTMFRDLMKPFLAKEVFPEDLLKSINTYLKNPSSSTSNTELLSAMRKYDSDKGDYLILEDLPDEAVFRIDNGFVFRKGEKLRKRFKCLRLDNKRMYLVSPMVKVVPVEA
jgi:hypothetical protein